MKKKTLKLYGYSGCSTCRQATKYLQGKALAFDEVDVTRTPPTLAELKAMLAAYGGQVRKLFNTSGQVYRELGLGEKLATMTTDDALKLLAGNGRLVKRPFLLVDGEARLVGFDEAAWGKLV